MMKFIRQVIFIFSVALSLILFQNFTTKDELIGKLESVELEEGRLFVKGYACQEGRTASPGVHIYVGNPNGTRTLVYKGKAEFIAEDYINKLCLSGGRYKFKMAIPTDIVALHKGKKLFAYGINLIPGNKNPELSRSADFRIPDHSSSFSMGCTSTALASASDGARSAYFPTKDFLSQTQGDEWIYLAWNWRENYLVETNHSVSVMKTKDLKNWYNLCGEKLTLPVSSNSKTVIDPVVMNGGLLNNVKIGFNRDKMPVVSYQKYKTSYSTVIPPVVTTQIYNATFNGKQFNIQQMTNWTTQHFFSGGGTIGGSDFSVAFSGVTYNALTDEISQTFIRAKADTSGSPGSGSYLLTKNELTDLWSLGVGFKAPVPFYRKFDDFNKDGVKDGPFSLAANTLEPRDLPLLPADKKFSKYTLPARFDERHVMLRGDWEGEGFNRAGVYDRLARKFIIRTKDVDKIFYFGPSTIPLKPLVGDWNNDGMDTIGVETFEPEENVSNKKFFKNSLEGGNADPVSGNLKYKDGTSVWHKYSPSSLYILKGEILAPNNDYAYDCQGRALKIYESSDTKSCADKFISDLALWEYTNEAGWTKSVVDKMWSGSSASIDFIVFKSVLIIAYYNRDRKVTIAIRLRNGNKWTIRSLDSEFKGWDSHNYLRLDVDENHDIHLSGNMHVHPLNYWKSSGLNAESFQRRPMVDVVQEQRTTYPTFSRDKDGNLLFSYRDGHSGDGVWIFNRYNSRKRSWVRFLDQPLFDKK